MKAIKLVAEPRTEKGSGPMGRLRRKGFVPAVVYGSGKGEHLIQLNAHDFEQFKAFELSERGASLRKSGGDKTPK